jgi:hypothetical protein
MAENGQGFPRTYDGIKVLADGQTDDIEYAYERSLEAFRRIQSGQHWKGEGFRPFDFL